MGRGHQANETKVVAEGAVMAIRPTAFILVRAFTNPWFCPLLKGFKEDLSVFLCRCTRG
jgi:hypothetical protein